MNRLPRLPDIEGYDGHFDMKIDRNLHRALDMEAVREGISLNDFLTRKIAEIAFGQSCI